MGNGIGNGIAASSGAYFGINENNVRVDRFDPNTLYSQPGVLLDGSDTAREDSFLPLVADPISGDLYAGGDGIMRISNPASSPSVERFAVLSQVNGMAVSADGSRIFAATSNPNMVVGYDRSGQRIFERNIPAEPDGVAVARAGITFNGQNLSRNLFVVANDGTVYRIDTNGDNEVTQVATGASPGDLITVGDDGCIYATLTDLVGRLNPCFFQPFQHSRLSGPDAGVTKAAGPSSVQPGADVVYRIGVKHIRDAAVNSVALVDELPSQVRFKSMTSTAGTCSTPGLLGRQTVQCDLGVLAPGSSATVEIAATVVAPPGESFTNTVEISGSNDADPLNNKASATTVVSRPGTVAGGVTDVEVPEGDSGNPEAVFVITLLRPASGVVRVDYEAVAGSAAPEADFIPVEGTLMFSPGEISTVVRVPVIADTVSEQNETFELQLVSADTTLNKPRGTGTILDDDGATIGSTV
ncbi:MAG: Calx-beta domain-containing protein, partial [Actinomycetota bacterium]